LEQKNPWVPVVVTAFFPQTKTGARPFPGRECRAAKSSTWRNAKIDRPDQGSGQLVADLHGTKGVTKKVKTDGFGSLLIDFNVSVCPQIMEDSMPVLMGKTIGLYDKKAAFRRGLSLREMVKSYTPGGTSYKTRAGTVYRTGMLKGGFRSSGFAAETQFRPQPI
jgi:hypothetical protein